MKVSDVAADRQMNSKRYPRVISSAEQRMVGVLRTQRQQVATGCFAQADLFFRSFEGGAVQKLAGLISAAKYSFAQSRVDVFRGRTYHGNLRVVYQHGSVAGDR